MSTRDEFLTEVRRRQQALEDAKSSPVGDEDLLLEQLAEVAEALQGGKPFPREVWEDHELHWAAHCAELLRSIRVQSAHIAMAMADARRVDPAFMAGDARVDGVLHWWQEQGGREEMLGSITLEERRGLEKMEREWREKMP